MHFRETYGDEFKVLEFATSRGAFEGLLNPQPRGADAVGDVDYAGEFLQLRIELYGDGGVILARTAWCGQRCLRLRLRLRW